MPSTRPCAAFEPLSPDFDIKALVESTPTFEWATRIQCQMIEFHGHEQFERLILMHVILGGKPLVIDGYEDRLDRWIFALQWLRDNCGAKVENARDLTKQTNVPMSIGHYLRHMALLTNQWTPRNYKDTERQRMYLKDIDCPEMWQEKVKEHIPPGLFYLNESSGDVKGMGAMDESGPNGAEVRKGHVIAKAGDLMSSLPPEMRAENLMCYIGHEGTYTPAHREMCASLGQNIMVEASTGKLEDGTQTKPGSSIWFMTETKEREVVSEYWLSRLGHDIEVEKHFAQVNAWKNAPFKTYVVEQKPGDLILIPPLAPHQVWNRGTRTMKIAWNRTTVETLEMAMDEALPKARMVCRDEQYKNKAIIYYTLQKYSRLLRQAEKLRQRNPDSKRVKKADAKVRQLELDFKRLHALFTRIMVSESFFPSHVEKKTEMVPFDSNITCSYCRCNIFNRFLTCPSCVEDLPDGDKDTYDICLDCYAMGRSCACISKLRWVEQWNWGELVQQHDHWRHQIVQFEGGVNEKSPRLLKTELDMMAGKRTLAQICQLELIKRPWRDIRKPESTTNLNDDVEEEVQVDENGHPKKRKVKKRSDKFVREHARCHVDCHWEPKWKQATCTKCEKNYCYGTLFRAYDMMPQTVMEDPAWTCPSCRKICNCRYCRTKPGYRKYTPKGTLLGHNTKAVADARSVESLVDFSFSNIGWIQKAGDDNEVENTRRMQKRKREARAAMAQNPELGENYVDEVDGQEQIDASILRLAEQEGIPIDPSLALGVQPSTPEEDMVVENPEDAFYDQFGHAQVSNDFSLPAGAIIQDMSHAYDPNDAITFVYPDPIAPSQIPPAPTEVYQEVQPVYGEQEEQAPQENHEIEMIQRKRKRGKVDDGDRPFSLKKAMTSKKSSRQRQSLVVKLAVPKDRLADITRAEALAQAALAAVEVPAPAIISDLQALNIYPDSEGPSTTQRVRNGERGPAEDADTEYAPSRRRDRKKEAVEEAPTPVQEEDVPRRTTRTQVVRYDEPGDEEEFNEIVAPKPKAAAMQDVTQTMVDSIEISDVESETSNSARGPRELDGSSRSPHNHRVQPVVNPPPTRAFKLSEASPNTTMSSRRTSVDIALASAAENRRVKMAAIEEFDDDLASPSPPPPLVEEGDDESAASSPEPNTSTSLQIRPRQSSSSASSTSTSPTPPPETVHPKVSGKAPLRVPVQSHTTVLASAPSTTGGNANISGSQPVSKSAVNEPLQGSRPPPVAAPKASAAEWADSDSSDDEEIEHRPQVASGGFTPINARAPTSFGNHSATSKKIGNHATPVKSVRGRPRGRPRARG